MKRNAFTLVELLVVITIIAILAAVFLGAMFSAQESSKDRKTRATIAKLHTIISERYEAYRSRRVPIQTEQGISPQMAAKAKLDCLRELMRIEMPDRFSDILDPTVSPSYFNSNGLPIMPNGSTAPPIGKTSVALSYARKLANAKPNYADDHDRAECLYLIVMANTADGESPIEMFRESEVADTDGDGLREFVDGWQRPIRFLRWAPGFVSEAQSRDPKLQPDPFDPRKVYPRTGQTDVTFALFPLIYSAGPDGDFDIYGGESTFTYSSANNNPFAGLVSPNVFPIGQIGMMVDFPVNGEQNWQDNIHNHLLNTR